MPTSYTYLHIKIILLLRCRFLFIFVMLGCYILLTPRYFTIRVMEITLTRIKLKLILLESRIVVNNFFLIELYSRIVDLVWQKLLNIYNLLYIILLNSLDEINDKIKTMNMINPY